MQWEFVAVALLVALVILFPVMLVLYLKSGDIRAPMWKPRKGGAAREERIRAEAEEQRTLTGAVAKKTVNWRALGMNINKQGKEVNRNGSTHCDPSDKRRKGGERDDSTYSDPSEAE